MTSLGNYGEDKAMDALTGKASWSPSPYLAFLNGAPGEDAAGWDEPQTNGYARTALNASDFSAAVTAGDWTNSSKTNSAAISSPTATGTWGNITHMAITDGATGTDLIWYGTLASTVTVSSGEKIEIAAGNLIVRIDDGSIAADTGAIMDDAANKMLDQTFNDPAISHTIYASLADAAPGRFDGFPQSETEYTGYARQALTAASWSASSGGITNYNAVIEFPINTSGSPETVYGVVLRDAATAGGFIGWIPFVTSIDILAGSSLRIPSGELGLRMID